MTVRIYVVGAVCAAMLGLAGCTTSNAGTPTPQPGDSESTSTESSESSVPSSEPDTYGAPRVENPLDASRFLADPCSVLTAAQLAAFGVSTPGRPDTEGAIATTVGPLCTWTADTEIPSTIGVAWQSGNENGLSDIYRMRDERGYFEEATVEGHPAVFSSGLDNRDGGDCTIVVGLSDTLTFTAGEIGQLDAVGACARAEQVAAAAVVTMRGN